VKVAPVPKKKYLIETFGCQMNVHDSERMAGLLDAAGYEPAADEREADLIVINTCSVRDHAEVKLYTRLGEIRQLGEQTGRKPTVTVAGCVAQQEGEALLKGSNGHVIDAVIGTQRLKMLPMIAGRADGAAPEVDVRRLDDVSFPLGTARRQDPVRAFVTIIEGCNDHCAFCVVPNTRGHERMRPRREILDDVAGAAAEGHREIHLLGQIVNHYQAPDDPGCDFAGLLEAVNAVPGVERIRFASPHPRHTSERLIAAVRDLDKVCKHVHLPAQSGSTRILEAMRRRHTRDDYLALVDRLREAIPEVTLSTDMIVGFPGETEEDFEQTLSLVETVGYHSMFSFKYSPRPGTLASQRLPDDIPEAEKTRRIVALQARQQEIQSALLARAVGTDVEVLVDGLSRRRAWELAGRTSGNVIVNFPVPAVEQSSGEPAPAWMGRTVRVRITRAGAHSLRGEVVARAATG